ncbi:hypothetical protein ULMS_26960 [Patiriisocius marinistellae]|uniref:Uncharacterized protein n=2 Tax=Patiriisocius marinistellae TaxID=2494560 RepID=A0A5J4G0F9_9FLAO|nr:hypothetical protein ULMS_26960 [Patiriisocius marinistellae]
MLDISSNNKGFLPPRISLTGINDTSTISANTEGMLVYNINNSPSGINEVRKGYYYWDGGIWRRLRTDGYSKKFVQSESIRASNNASNYVTLPNLDQNITPAVSGTYQIIVNAYYAVEKPTGTTNVRAKDRNGRNLNVYTTQRNNSAGQGSVRLLQNNTTPLGEKYVASYGMTFPDGTQFWAHGQSLVLVENVFLTAGTTYNFKVQGREWSRYNSIDAGIFGWETNGHLGNVGGTAKAQHGDMTITLIGEN